MSPREPGTTAVRIAAGDQTIAADLSLPSQAQGVVLFAHGSGSSRFSPRNRLVANYLQQAGIGTLLLDLLTEAEEQIDLRTGEYRFDIPLLARRLVMATDWAAADDQLSSFPLGYFGASTGAAAALVAAVERPDRISAIVSRGGRPDLAGPALAQVQAPTLLIVGGADELVLELNRQALAELPGRKQLEVVPGATHLFEEPGKLEEVARLARHWFQSCFSAAADAPHG